MNRKFFFPLACLERIHSRHPHIFPLYDSGEERIGNMTVNYLVMPYRQEGSLSDWLRRGGQAGLLVPSEVAHVEEQAVSTLQHAHDRQIIHQDVKPSNLLLRLRPDLLLADSGIARFSAATSNASQSIRGTPTSRAPEQWEGYPVPAIDQYALSVMAYELLTGRLPFQGAPGPLMYQHLTVPAPPPSSVNPRLSAELDAVLLHALAKRPEQLFASLIAFATAFQQAVQGMPATSAPTRTAATPVPSSPGDLRAVLAISTVGAQVGTMRALTLPGGKQVRVPVLADVRDRQVVCLDGQGETSPSGGVIGALILGILVKTEEEPSPFASASEMVAEDTVLTANPTAPATGVPTVGNTGQQPMVSSALRPEMTVPPSPAVEPTQVTAASQVVPTATELALPKEPSGGRQAPTTLPTQVGQRPGVVPADRSSPLPAPIIAQPQRGISRRTFMLRLAELTIVGAAASSLVLLACDQQPSTQTSQTSLPGSTTLYTFHGHSGAVYTVAWLPGGKRIASGSTDGTVQVWDALDGSHVFTYRGHSDVVETVACSLNGKRIASGSRDQTVQVWDATDGGHVFTYRGHSSIVKAVTWSPDGKRIASGSLDHTVQVWDAVRDDSVATDGSHVFTYRGHSSIVKTVAWSPDGRRIASGSLDGTVQVWDALDGGHVFTYRGHSFGVNAVAWSPDSKRIASGSLDHTVQVWDAVGGDSVATDGSHVFTYRGHSNVVLAVAWSLDGRRIASGGDDNTVQIWDAIDGGHVFTYRGHSDVVEAVASSPDGKRIASGGDDNTVQVWVGA